MLLFWAFFFCARERMKRSSSSPFTMLRAALTRLVGSWIWLDGKLNGEGRFLRMLLRTDEDDSLKGGNGPAAPELAAGMYSWPCCVLVAPLLQVGGNSKAMMTSASNLYCFPKWFYEQSKPCLAKIACIRYFEHAIGTTGTVTWCYHRARPTMSNGRMK